ncbi:EAL domain-containing protein [Bacillus sp. 1P10SD]|uniref:EAL domain-containing protein n=1 Tax=Bacillus sp. 1P10SD TaxID=3132265 RepID=UPI0039A4204F
MGTVALLCVLFSLIIIIGCFYVCWRILTQQKERKQTEAKLMESEDRYRSLVELSPKGILVYQDHKIAYANSAALSLLKSTDEHVLIGKSLLDLVHPESKEELITNLQKVLNGELVALHEYKFNTMNGETIFIEAVGSTVMFNGKPALMAIGSDITEKKNLQEQLNINEQRYKSLFEYHSDAVYSFDLNGKFTSANKACETISGYSPDELLYKHFTDFIYVDDLQKTIDIFASTYKNGGSPQNHNIRLNHKKGYMIHLNVTSVPIIVNEQVVGIYGIAKDITEQIHNQETIRHLAYHDYLTGLPNRNLLDNHLSKELDLTVYQNRKLAVLFIDLDRFKAINDTFGHSVGDLLLKEVAKRLKSSVLEKDLVFRQGGDEFIVILDDADRRIAEKVAMRILSVLASPFSLNQSDLFISPSIGISLYSEDGESMETLIKHADFAMYQAKKAGKNTFRFYSNHETVDDINPLLMEMDLHKAIERQEFILHYQPKINLKTGKVIGAEALIRWNHPERGMIPPSQFIPIAEETGLIIPIGEWVLHEACMQQKKWMEQGFSNMVISVNLSARQFSQCQIVQAVKKVLEETGLEPQHLELEITESMTMDIERTIITLQELKKLGLLISIDDFGTGFSSLNYLKQFPVDTLKIDQSFVRELYNQTNDETIVKTIITMAHTLQLNVVAEGIETREQLVFLQQHLCDTAQGYFFSQPVPVKEWNEAFFSTIEETVSKFGISQDTTKRMWMEETVRIARQELQDTLQRQQGLTIKYTKIDEKFVHTLCEGTLLRRFGLLPEQIIGKELHEFLPAKQANEKLPFYEKAWAGEENVTYEAKVNGIYYLAALSPLKKCGKVVEVIVSCSDITTLKETEKALRESQEMYRLVADNMTDLITVFDLDGKIKYASPSHKSVLGYPASYYENYSSISNLHPEDQTFYKRTFVKTINSKQPCIIQYRISTHNGGWKLFEVKLTPVTDEQGKVIHVIGVAKDLTGTLQVDEEYKRG